MKKNGLKNLNFPKGRLCSVPIILKSTLVEYFSLIIFKSSLLSVSLRGKNKVASTLFLLKYFKLEIVCMLFAVSPGKA